MTRHPRTASGRPKLRLLRPAAIEHEWTPGVEAASAGWIDRARHVAFQDHRGAGGPGLRHRHGREQCLGVGMFWRGKHLLPWPHLANLADIPPTDPLRHLLDNPPL